MYFLLWLIAVILVVYGIVCLIRGAVVLGIVLIILGLLIGPGGVSIFSMSNVGLAGMALPLRLPRNLLQRE